MVRDGCVALDVLPADITTVVLHVRQGRNAPTAWVTMPPHLIRRHKLQEGEQIVLVFIGRATPTTP